MPDLAEREPARDSSGSTARPDARSSGRVLAWCLLGGVVASSLTPLPWSLASGLFYLAGTVAAVVTLRRVTGPAAVRRGVVALVAGGLVLSLLMTFGVLLEIAFYPVVSELESCLARAITESGQDACQDAVMQRFDGLLPGRR